MGGVITNNNFNNKWLIKRMKRLLIPYIIWAFINSLYHIVLEGIPLISFFQIYFIKLFILPVPWFLLNLFLCDISLFLHEKIKFNILLLFVGYYCIWCGIAFITKLEIAKNMVLFYPYYAIGYCVSCYREQKKLIVKEKIRSVLIIIYVLSMFFYTYGVENAYEKAAQIIYVVPILNNSIKLIQYGLILYSRYIVGLLGIGFAYSVATLCNKYEFTKHINKILSLIGTRTIYIYLIGSMCEVHFFENRLTNAVVSMILGVCIPLIIAFIMKKIPKINKIMFG